MKSKYYEANQISGSNRDTVRRGCLHGDYNSPRHGPGGRANLRDVRGIKIPVAVSAFAEEIYQAPQSWAEKAYAKLILYNKHDKGTHFADWEQPELFVNDLRAAFKTLR